MSNRGRFKTHKRVMVTYDSDPAPGDMIWVDQVTGFAYNFDNLRQKWLSTTKDAFEFARKGPASGMYIPLLGDLDNADDVYITGYPATIVGVFCRSKDGKTSKVFDVLRNGAPIYSFSYDHTYTHTNNNLDIDIDANDEINFYVSSGKDKVKNTVCRVILARRYEK